MKILDMIAEWRKGCSNAGEAYDHMMQLPEGTTHPAECSSCTIGLIEAIERYALNSKFSARVIPDLYERICALRKASASDASLGNPALVVVKREDLDALLHEFYWQDAELRRLATQLFDQSETIINLGRRNKNEQQA